MCGLAIDFETSGFSLPHYASKHQGISFGAIVFELKTFEPVESLYQEIKFKPTYTWSFDAERIHGLSREHLEQHGVSQEEAACALGTMILKYFATEEIILLGHRVYFDEAFTNQLMASIGVELAYDPIKFDSAAFSLAFLEVSYSDKLFDLVGLPPRTLHNSLEDITYTLAAMKAIKNGVM